MFPLGALILMLTIAFVGGMVIGMILGPPPFRRK